MENECISRRRSQAMREVCGVRRFWEGERKIGLVNGVMRNLGGDPEQKEKHLSCKMGTRIWPTIFPGGMSD